MTAETTVTMQADLRETSKNDPILLAAIHAVQNGDSRAFEQIMIATERRVALLCWRILGDADAVKDAMQEVFLRVFRHLRKFDERRDFMGWLFRITVNVCRDHSSRQKKRTQVFTDLEEAESIGRADDTDARIAAKEELALL